MHERYGKDGLVCVSISLDNPKEREAALKFLQGVRAHFTNFLLDEDLPTWQKKFDIIGPPAVFVFDREGKRAGKFDHNDPAKEYTYPDVEKLVRSLLQKQE